MTINFDRTFTIGILICFLGCISGALGDLFVRKAFSIRNSKKKSYYVFKIPYWWFGIFFSLIGNVVCTVFALTMVPLSIVTSFAGLHILFVIIISKLWLRETLNFMEFWGAFLQLLGVVIIVKTSQSKQFSGYNEIKSYFLSLESYLYLSIDFLIVLLTMTFPISSGIAGGITNIFAKASLLINQFLKSDSFDDDGKKFFILIICFTFTSLTLQGTFWNIGFRYANAGFVVTIINSFLVVSGAAGSILIFKEYPKNNLIFFLGIIILLIGISLLFIFEEGNINITEDGYTQCLNTDRLFETEKSQSLLDSENYLHNNFNYDPKISNKFFISN